MTPSRIWMFVAAVAACVLAISNESSAQTKAPVALVAAPASAPASAPAAAATRVGTCDIVYVFNNFQRASDLKKEFEARGRDLQSEAEKRRKAIETLASELQGLKEGSKEFDQRLSEMQRLDIEFEAWKKLQDAQLKRDHYRLTREMYDQLLKAVDGVAKERGFDLVIFNEPREIRSSSEEELLQQIAQRKVLYADGRIDITAAVLDRANAGYKAAAPVVPAAPAPTKAK